ncbi:MAG: hypothetical protein ACLS8R_06125 [Anaeromassilibacillus sp.]
MLNKEEMKRALGPASVFEIGGINSFGQYFDGTSYLQMLTTTGVSVGNVVFEPGCRNHWHRHVHGGQILLCTGCRAIIEWGLHGVYREMSSKSGRKHCTGAAKQLVFPFGNRCREKVPKRSG